MNLKNLISELKRRNVFKVATAYVIAGWLIIQVSDTVFPRLGLPEWTVTFIIVLVLIGFPITLIIAWAFELTPDGLKKSEEVDITNSVTKSTGKKLNGIIIGVLSAALLFVLAERIFFAESTMFDSADTETPSIAVLPFVNMSADQQNEYFSDGLSEELMNGLAKLEDIQVTGRTSSFQYKDKTEDLRIVAEELGVRHILEGSVRKSGNRIRITAQLIRADNGFHLWSETYDRELTASDIFDIQEEITRNIVRELQVRLLDEETEQLAAMPTQDIEAYNAFLIATQLVVSRQADDIEQAIELYKQAIKLDPSFAEAHARLAEAYHLLWANGDFPLEETKKLIRRHVDQALLLDGNQGRAYRALGIYYNFENDQDNSLKAYERAKELLPNDPDVLYSYGQALMWVGKFADRTKYLEKAYTLDPLNPTVANLYGGLLLIEKGDYDKAEQIFNNILAKHPDFTPTYRSKSWLYRGAPHGELGQAFELAYNAHEREPKSEELLSLLTEISRDVNMLFLAEYYTNRIKDLYPNNPAILYQQIINKSASENVTAVDSLLQISKERYGSIKGHGIAHSQVLYAKGEYQQGINRIEKRSPEVKDSTLDRSIHEYPFSATAYLGFLKKTGELEQAEQVSREICRFAEQQLAELPEENQLLRLNLIKYCQIASGDYESAVNTLSDIYFKLNSKVNKLWFTKSHIPYLMIKEAPNYDEFEAAMHADLKKYRDEIVLFLKEKGEWKEEWNSEI